MKKVNLAQLVDKVILDASEPLAIEHEGRLLGYFYPAFEGKDKMATTPREALEGLRQLRSSLPLTDVVEIVNEGRRDLERQGLF